MLDKIIKLRKSINFNTENPPIINKKEFEKKNWDNPRNLNDIDDKLSDYIEWWEINRYWLPNRCVWWYINWVSYHKNHNFNWNIWQ